MSLYQLSYSLCDKFNLYRIGKEFCQILGEVMKRPSWLPVPDFALEILLGEGAKIVLEGQEVLPKATQAIDFDYRYPNLEAALEKIVPKMYKSDILRAKTPDIANL